MQDINTVIDSVSQKFGYDDELKEVLKKVVPFMAKGKSEEVSKMLCDTLNRVKIFVLDEDSTYEKVEECKKEVMKDANSNVVFKEEERGEYSKRVAKGAYVSEPVFDEEMNITGRNGFIYVSRISEYSDLKGIYGTTINLSHLIHELGHAWASEKDEYVQKADGTFETNIGACRMTSKIDKDKREVEEGYADLLYIEEALNTIEEENTLMDVLGIDSMESLKSKGYVPSNYQGMITDMMRSYVEKFGNEPFDNFRYLKDKRALEDIETSIRSTDAWEEIKSAEYTNRKREKFGKINDLEVTDGAKQIIKKVVEEYDDVYFPDNSKFTPLQKLDNVFTQIDNFSVAKYNFGIVGNEKNLEIYKTVITSMTQEGYVLKNQVKDTKEVSNDFFSGLKDGVKKDDEVVYESKSKEDSVRETDEKSR